MFTYDIIPRRSETNATGHIDHTVLPVWFEQARTPIYEIFNPDLSLATWNTVIRSMTIDYLGQVYHNRPIEIRTAIGEIKTSSFNIEQELWQAGTLVARARTVLVYFDYQHQRKQAITPDLRQRLQALTRPEN